MIHFIGDPHGKFKRLNQIIYKLNATKESQTQIILLGDIGLGFPGHVFPDDFGSNVHFIRGNHDNPNVCFDHKNYLGDYGFNKELNLFFVSGAYSIDQNYRVPGVSWWVEEELSINHMNQMIDLYAANKPQIMVSHDCPESIYNFICPDGRTNRTAQALQACLDIHQPKYWVYGHHHKDQVNIQENTTFVCVNELTVRSLDGGELQDLNT